MADGADSSQFFAALHVFMICWCNEKDLSKIIPRFLSDLLNSIGMPFICKDEGKASDIFVRYYILIQT